MADVASASGLSAASSRSEHMAYLTAELGLDRATAALMYRAERLQEKGQPREALRYFERVLAGCPDCEEALVNVRMIREQLAEQQMPAVQEGPAAAAPSAAAAAAAPSGGAQPTTLVLPLDFQLFDKEEWDAYWDEFSMRRTAIQMAKNKLMEYGIDTPFLEVVRLDVESSVQPEYIDPWMDNRHRCRAEVKVTLIPNELRNRSRDEPLELPGLASLFAAAARAPSSAPSPLAGTTGAAASSAPPALAGTQGAAASSAPPALAGKAATVAEPEVEPQESMIDRLRGSAQGSFVVQEHGSSCAAAAVPGTASEACSRSSHSSHSGHSFRSVRC